MFGTLYKDTGFIVKDPSSIQRYMSSELKQVVQDTTCRVLRSLVVDLPHHGVLAEVLRALAALGVVVLDHFDPSSSDSEDESDVAMASDSGPSQSEWKMS